MNTTPQANRLHIALYGRRNAGKSRLLNAITGQEMAIVSEHAGTTADPVFKAMEIPGIGPCVLIDTAGFDDTGDLGKLRVQKTEQTLSRTDLALIVCACRISPWKGNGRISSKLQKSHSSQSLTKQMNWMRRRLPAW